MIHHLARMIPSVGLRGDGRSVRVGIGDDAAILKTSAAPELVLSCDASLEGVHFHSQHQSPESVGYRSLARATSDLAAMGAIPGYFLLTLALPREKTGSWLHRFARGMARGAREFGMRLIGGDISRAPSVSISITVLGSVTRGSGILRSGARPGDLIYVSGKLGRAQLGLELVLRGLSDNPQWRRLVQPHYYPKIRLKLGQWLASHHVASAMMDLSDGLSMDLTRLCLASKAGAQIFAEELPRFRNPAPLSRHNLDPLMLALHGGEDYELLFTVPPKHVPRLRACPGFASLRRIGQITKKREILLIASDGTASRLPPLGWDHFRSPRAKLGLTKR